jgi:carbamoyltransferase
VAAASEERFTRIKNDPSLPENAIEYVLEEGGLAPRDLDAVVFYESPFAKFDRLLTTQFTGEPRSLPTFIRTMTTWIPQKLRVETAITGMLGRKMRVLYCDHHLSHAASAFYPSPYDEAAILTVDGVGEWTTTSIGRGDGEGVKLLEHIEYPNSLGMFYSTFTAYCGFRVNSGEYKLMGLAPYGEPRFTEKLLAEVIELCDDGSYALNPEYFTYVHTNRSFGGGLESLLGGPGRGENDDLEQRHADIAASVQVVLNRAMGGLARRARTVTGIEKLVMAGGVALNVVTTSYLENEEGISDIWVQPAAGDAGGALGAALWASYDLLGFKREAVESDSMQGAFLGPSVTRGSESVRDIAAEYGLVTIEGSNDELHRLIAELLAKGDIVGVARGRMEFGPRALGNRSILADARNPQMQRRLNLATKFREGFRPFAPVVLAEHAAEWFHIKGESPYMLKTYQVHNSKRGGSAAGGDFLDRISNVGGEIPAVTHLDGSARVQTVDMERHPELHALLHEFYALTGCPVLVNTSFNVRGEPIVCNARDAIHGLLRSDIDALLLENVLVIREQQSTEALSRAVPEVSGRD